MKKMLYLLGMACALLVGQPGHAKSMKDMWLSMPDSLAPTLTQNMRLEMVELQDMKVRAEVANALGDSCVMDTLTHNFLQVQLSKVCLLQAKLLPTMGGDSILCVVKTFSGPEKESEVAFYNQDWHQKDATHLFGGNDFAALYDRLVQKPDTMREKYHNTAVNNRGALTRDILSMEQQIDDTHQQLKRLEAQLRTDENKLIKK